MLAIKFNMLSSWAAFISTGAALLLSGCVPASPAYGSLTVVAAAAYGGYTVPAAPVYAVFTVPSTTAYSTGC